LLQTNVGVLSGRRCSACSSSGSRGLRSESTPQQVPEYAPIKFAGHEAGDLFFVRASN